MINQESPHPVSRREFARHVAVAAAAALAAPQEVLGQGTAAEGPVPPPLAPGVAEEADAKFSEVLRRNGSKFSLAQKQELRNQLIGQVKGLQKLRTYALGNGDAPATVLQLPGMEGKP